MNEKSLLTALQGCSLHAFILLLSACLARAGFGDVEVMDRRMPGQKSRFGGYELRCRAIHGTTEILVIVKVVRDSIRLRMLDELAGAAIRSGAHVGILATPYISKEATSAYGSVHLEVLDGTEIGRLMAKFGLGVRKDGFPDYAYFGELEAASERLLNVIPQIKVGKENHDRAL